MHIPHVRRTEYITIAKAGLLLLTPSVGFRESFSFRLRVGDSGFEHMLCPEIRSAWLTPVAQRMNTQPGVGVLGFRSMKHPDESRFNTQPARMIQRGRKGYLPPHIFAVKKSMGSAGAVMAMMPNPVRGVEDFLTRNTYIER